nr:DivIVA domain-containing protein [Motilibacter aurantiacus]
MGAGEPVAAADVRRAGFDLVRHGYDIGAVDRLLDRLERRCVEQAMADEPLWALEDDLRASAGRLRDQLSGAPGARFARLGRMHRGYDPADVDALVERVLRTLDPFSATPEGAPVEADDVRFTVFGRVRGGYVEPAVDDVLDRVIDLLLRHAVLRAQLAAAEVVQALGPDAFTAPAYEEPPARPLSGPEPPLPAAGAG